jgi:hypothetical protein
METSAFWALFLIRLENVDLRWPGGSHRKSGKSLIIGHSHGKLPQKVISCGRRCGRYAMLAVDNGTGALVHPGMKKADGFLHRPELL